MEDYYKQFLQDTAKTMFGYLNDKLYADDNLTMTEVQTIKKFIEDCKEDFEDWFAKH